MKQTHLFKLLLLLLVSPVLVCQAHTGSIRGIIYDGVTHKPVEGVSVSVEAANANSLSDAFGKFFIKGLPPGRCKISLSCVGYETKTESLVVEDGVTTDITCSLAVAPVQISSVSVNAGKSLSLGSISGIDLKLRPVNNTQDMLRLVPGLFTAQHQGGGKAEQIFLRGFDCDHGTDVNINVDNMPVNMVSHAHGQGFADTHFIIPEVVQRVDYGKGPYTIDKGNLCTAGFIDFKTRNSLDNSFVKAEGGSYDYFRTVAGINILNRAQTDTHQDAYIIGEYGYNRGFFDQSQNFNRFNLLGKYTNYLSADKVLSLTLSGFGSSWDASGQVPARAIALGITDRLGGLDPEGGQTSRYNVNLQYLHNIGSNTYFKSNAYFTYYTFLLYSDFTYFLTDSVNGDQVRQAEKRAMGGYSSEYNTNYAVGGLKMKTQAGVGLRYDDVMNDELSHTLDKTVTLQQLELGDVHETNLYSYVSESICPTSRLTANFGSRYDYLVQQYDNKLPADRRNNSFYGGVFSPKAGLNYSISDNARIYYNYGTGFHTNDTRTLALEQQFNTAITIKQAVPLAFSHDLGIVAKPFNTLLVSAALWRLDMQQEYTYDGDVAIVDSAGRTRRYGVDISARYQLLQWLLLDVDVNYAHARAVDQPAGNNFIPLAPLLTSVGGITGRINKQFSASLRYRHMSDRPANPDNSLTAKGYTLFDLVANYSCAHYECSLQVQNVFNTVWSEAQFATETRLKYPGGMLEPAAKTDICFTPGTPLFLKLSIAYKF